MSKAVGDVVSGLTEVPKIADMVINAPFHPQQSLQAAEEIPDVAKAIGKHIYDRYGSVENFKNTLANDPAGALLDLFTVAGGGTGLLEKVPGELGAVARTGGEAVKALDPVNNAGFFIKKGTQGVGYGGSELLGMRSGVGGESIRAAAHAGLEGGQKNADFLANLRQQEPMSNVVAEGENAIQNLKTARSADYAANMAPVTANGTALDFAPIYDAVNQAFDVGSFKGQHLPSTEAVKTKVLAAIKDWEALPPEYHTPAGFDFLKQKIGEIDVTTPQQEAVRTRVYNAVKNAIENESPDYADAMKGYGDASNEIKDISNTFSLGKRSTDTALRKLQSALRPNVNTNFGRRLEQAQTLQEAGAPNLIEKLAGQNLSSWAPRGLRAQISAAQIPTAIATAFVHPAISAALLADLVVQSPRLVGEAANLVGRALGPIARAFSGAPVRPLAYAGYQAEKNQ